MQSPGGTVEFHQVLGGCEPYPPPSVFDDRVHRLIQMQQWFGRSPKGWCVVSQAVGSAQPEPAAGLGDDIVDTTGKCSVLRRILFEPIHEPEQRRAFNSPNTIRSEPTAQVLGGGSAHDL